MPKADHKRLDSVCSERSLSAKVRVVWRWASTCMRGMPPAICGLGSGMGCNGWAKAGTTSKAASRGNKAVERWMLLRLRLRQGRVQVSMIPPDRWFLKKKVREDDSPWR